MTNTIACTHGSYNKYFLLFDKTCFQQRDNADETGEDARNRIRHISEEAYTRTNIAGGLKAKNWRGLVFGKCIKLED